MKKLILVAFLFLPVSAFASALPAFPMAFYGAVTINGTAAPVGTVVRAYNGNTLAGSVTTLDAGIYGYDVPTKQQLLVGEGTGTIRFTVTSGMINSGVETDGASAQISTGFSAGAAVQKDLAFTWSAPVPPPAPTPPPSGGGGGGGGGGGPSYNYGCMDKKARNYSWLANHDDGHCQYATSTPPSTGTTTNHDNHDNDHGHRGGEVLGASTTVPCADFVHGYIGYGRNNDKEDVKRLQTFLNKEMHANLPVTGYFGLMTHGWVKKFQVKYRNDILGANDHSDGTGYVYKETLKHLNKLCCTAVR